MSEMIEHMLVVRTLLVLQDLLVKLVEWYHMIHQA
jgi:hypothetical protein